MCCIGRCICACAKEVVWRALNRAIMESENEEEGIVSYKSKYRQLKNRLKYLIYEHECFENDIQKAQAKLLQLSRDKSFLLDQLIRYEAVVLSGGEETDYSSGEDTGLTLPDTLKAENGPKSDSVKHSLKATPPPSSQRTTQPTKTAVSKSATAVIHSTTSTTTGSSKTSVVKSGGGVKKTAKPATKVSAVAVAKITKAVARARQNPQTTPNTASPLIVSLPLNPSSLSGRSKQPQTTPTKHLQTMSTAAILASIPAPPKPLPSKTVPPSLTTAPRPTGKGLTTALSASGRTAEAAQSRASSSSSSSSSSDSEDSVSESSSSSTSREETMDTGGPVPMVHSVPIPAGAPQLVRPKAIVSPVKAPPKLIPMSDTPLSSSTSHTPLLSPLTHSPGTQSQVTRFLWSNRASSGEGTPTAGFTSIAPLPLSSPTSLNKPSSGSAFQLVTSPPGSATLSRPPSLQDMTAAPEMTTTHTPPP